MITALISSLLGMAGGLLPDIFKEIRESREHGRELERLDKQAEIQARMLAAQTDAKLAEIQGNAAVEEMRAFAKQMEAIYAQQAPVGIRWVDAFNAAIRPGVATVMMIVFVGSICLFSWAVYVDLEWDRITAYEASQLFWSGLIGEAIQGVLGYLFGFRSTSSAVGAIRNRQVSGLPWLKK